MAEITESQGYKNFMKYVYGWGASVVLIGALFKIQHFPGASIMLTVGLIIEALIFFFSAFEPLHEELDWTLVYPELAGLSDEFDEEETSSARKFDRIKDVSQIENSDTGGQGYGGSPSALLKFDEMLEKADIGPEIFDKLGEGLNNLSATTKNLSDIGEAGVATKDFVAKMQNATVSVGKLDETYSKSSEALRESVNNLSETYSNAASTFNESSAQLTESYTNFANKLTQEIETVGNESGNYSNKLGELNSNLASLNAVYELQVSNINNHIESSNEYYSGLKNMADNIDQTIENSRKLNAGVEELENNIASLNSIYGNMLSSLNFNK
jgi:gliding motility-associated protein GldL